MEILPHTLPLKLMLLMRASLLFPAGSGRVITDNSFPHHGFLDLFLLWTPHAHTCLAVVAWAAQTVTFCFLLGSSG